MIDFYERLKRAKKHHRKTIELDELYEIIADGNYQKMNKYKTTEYDDFYEIICSLERNGVLRKKGKPLNANPLHPLALKYEIIQATPERLAEEETLFLHNLNRHIYTASYHKNVHQFRQDRPLLEALNDFLNNPTSHSYLSVKERSLQLFDDEKLLQSSNILARTHLTLQHLWCLENPAPLLHFCYKSFYERLVRHILIIENLDTFYSIGRYLSAQKETFFDMIIYGQGNKITTEKYDFSLHGITINDKIYYFGDLDSQGLYIYLQFKQTFKQYHISLYLPFYEYLLVCARTATPKERLTQHTVSINNLKKELVGLSIDEERLFLDIVTNKYFIPQEHLNLEILQKEEARWNLKNKLNVL